MDTEPATSTASVLVGAQVPPRLADELRAVARLNERTVSAEIRLALRAHIGRNARMSSNDRDPSITSGLRETDDQNVHDEEYRQQHE